MCKFILTSVSLLVFSFVFAQKFETERISIDAGIHTDRRPIDVGFYSPEVEKTFVTWMGAYSHPVIKEFDHKTKSWSEDKMVGESPFADKHNYPGIIKGADDHLYVFYGCHNSTLKMARSAKPLSIDGTWEDMLINEAERASYPAPVITDDGTMYVFYRDTRKTNNYSDDRPYQYIISKDNGKTWVRNMAIDNFPRDDNFNEIYNGKVSYQPARSGVSERIHISWTICGGGPGKHAHATFGTNVYYAYLSTKNGHFYNIRGKDLGLHIDNNEADTFCLVADLGFPKQGHLAGLQISVHYLNNGTPIVFHNMPGKGYGSSKWDGENWTFSGINKNEHETRDIYKIGESDTFCVYLTDGTKVLMYQSENAGLTWTLINEIDLKTSISRCFQIKNYHPDVRLLVTEIKNDNKNVKEANRDVFIVREIK